MNKEINLKGRDVLKIKALPGVFDYKEDTKMKGKKYRRFSYNGAVFIANTEDEFVTLKDSGKLYSADLQLTMDGEKAVLTLLNQTSSTQEKEMAKTESELNYILNSFNPAKVDESLLNDLA